MKEIEVKIFEVTDDEHDSLPSIEFFSQPDASEELLNKISNNWESKFILKSPKSYLYFEGVTTINKVDMDEEGIWIQLIPDSYPEWYKNQDQFLKEEI